MSQKSSAPQAAKFVSQALKRDIVLHSVAVTRMELSAAVVQTVRSSRTCSSDAGGGNLILKTPLTCYYNRRYFGRESG
jgi:hypothetical protein